MPPAASSTLTKPLTRQELFDRIRQQTGASADQTRTLMQMFEDTVDLIDPDTGTSDWLRVTMSAHDALDAIMPDMTPAIPGSLHDEVDRHFLGEGWTFQHDRHIHCSLQAVRR